MGNKQAFFKGLFDGDSDSVKFDQSGSFLARVRKLYDPATLAAASAGAGSEEIELPELADVGLDDEVADPFEDVIEAGDESQDQVEPGAEAAAEPAPVLAFAPVPPEPVPPAAETALTERKQAAMPAAGEVRRLFSQLQVRRGQSGNVVIEAPAEAASTRSALFEGMAALLHSASQPAE